MVKGVPEGSEGGIEVRHIDVVGVQRGRGDGEHRNVDEAGQTHRDDHVPLLEVEDLLLLFLGRTDDSTLREGRVQVDHVWHHRRAQDARAQEHALGAIEAGRDEAGRDRAHRWPGEDDLERECGDDDADQHRDHGLEAPEPARLQGEDAERGEGGDDPGHEQRDGWKEQMDADGRADELGEVGGHGDDLGLQPQSDHGGKWEFLPAHLGEVEPGRDAELRAH